MPTQKGMHKEDIKAAVRKTGTNLKALSLKLHLSPTTTHKSLIKAIPSANAAIAELLGRPLHEIWPDWYDRAGQRIKSRPGRKPKRKSRARH